MSSDLSPSLERRFALVLHLTPETAATSEIIPETDCEISILSLGALRWIGSEWGQQGSGAEPPPQLQEELSGVE